jgi:hypothetical protein
MGMGGIYRPGVRSVASRTPGTTRGGIAGAHCACPQYCRCCGQVLR